MRNEAMFTSEGAEHNTPEDIIEAIRDVFGGAIDFDPASNEAAQAYIRANRYRTAADDAYRRANGKSGTLADQWACRSLWLNPPFTIPTGRYNAKGKEIRERVIGLWVDRWLTAVSEREAYEAALLVPARTDTEWFDPLFGLPMCFISGRLRFSGADNGAPFPTVIVYAGGNRDRFFERFEAFGNVGKFTR